MSFPLTIVAYIFILWSRSLLLSSWHYTNSSLSILSRIKEVIVIMIFYLIVLQRVLHRWGRLSHSSLSLLLRHFRGHHSRWRRTWSLGPCSLCGRIYWTFHEGHLLAFSCLTSQRTLAYTFRGSCPACHSVAILNAMNLTFYCWLVNGSLISLLTFLNLYN